MPKAAFVYSDQLSRQVLREDHPLQARRLRLTYELLESYGAFQHPDALLVAPSPATEAELLLIHAPEYIEAVEGISRGESYFDPARYNLSAYGDNPPYPGMYEASALSTGASLVAADLLLEGRARVAFSISGGLHHAAWDHASGFCIFNDPAVAIAHLVGRGLRVAYVDIDAHHGDGVQNAFYDTDRVLTISLHESGRYLFPGTGEVTETGSGRGAGYSVNLPFLPYTGDSVYCWAFDQIVPPLVSAFRPDVLVAQLGVDAYFRDPLAHLQLSTRTYGYVAPQLLTLAPLVLALGGGGYDPEAVARVWTLEYGLMLGIEWPDAIPGAFSGRYGVHALRDAEAPQNQAGVEEQTREYAEAGVEALKRTVFPIHGIF